MFAVSSIVLPAALLARMSAHHIEGGYCQCFVCDVASQGSALSVSNDFGT